MAARKPTPRRTIDWFIPLEVEVRRATNRAFTWGAHDCCQFAVRCIEAMTGVDCARHLGAYTTGRGARFRLAKHGGVAGLAENVAARHGFDEIPTLKAAPGDVVVIERGGETALGVVDFSGRNVFVADTRGLRALPLADAIRAWRIP